jgi:hypothetical protein
MRVNTNPDRIIIILETQDEKDAIEDFVAKHGEIGIKEQMQLWINSRVATHQETVKADVWTKLSVEERTNLRNQVKDRKK